MTKSILVLFVFFTLNYSLIGAIISSKKNQFSVQLIGQAWAKCLDENEIVNCFAKKISETLDKAMANNETWQLSDFVALERNKNQQKANNEHPEQDHLDNTLAMKLLKLAEARSLRLQLPSSAAKNVFDERSISTALDDVNGDGAVAATTEQEEGRKRKHKDKNMAVFGGMAMLALVVQMFFGKVILIAGAAFVMAKVALLISALGSLRNGTPVGAPINDHVIVTRGGVASGHSLEHISDWHRRSPYEHSKFEATSTGTITNRSRKLL